MNTQSKTSITTLIGNLLEHYDACLFSLLIPFIAPLFFPKQDQISALLYTFLILPVGLITKLFGALYFSRLSQKYSVRGVLLISIYGMAVTTLLMGLAPTYSSVGILAPVILVIYRMKQSFFSSTESAAASIHLMSQASKKNKGIFGALFDISSMLGIFLGSFLIGLVSIWFEIETYWRVFFLLGSLIGFVAYKMRLTEPLVRSVQTKVLNPLETLKKHKSALATVTIASGFSHVTYSFCFTFLNGFLPLVTPFSKKLIISSNTMLICMDIFFLLLAGILLKKINREKMMLTGIIGIFFIAPLAFLLIPKASLVQIMLIRGIMIAFSICFAASYHSFVFDNTPKNEKFLLISAGNALGSQLIGAPTAAVSLYLYKLTNRCEFASGYFIFIALLALIVLLQNWKRQTQEKVYAQHS